MRGYITVEASPVYPGGWRCTATVVASWSEDAEAGERRAQVVADALEDELVRANLTVMYAVKAALAGGSTLEVIQAARLLDRAGVRPS